MRISENPRPSLAGISAKQKSAVCHNGNALDGKPTKVCNAGNFLARALLENWPLSALRLAFARVILPVRLMPFDGYRRKNPGQFNQLPCGILQ